MTGGHQPLIRCGKMSPKTAPESQEGLRGSTCVKLDAIIKNYNNPWEGMVSSDNVETFRGRFEGRGGGRGCDKEYAEAAAEN